MIGCVIFCAYRMYKNNEARREARMYLYRTARENMARIEQENNNYYSNNGSYSQEDSVDLEKKKKKKLDKLFNVLKTPIQAIKYIDEALRQQKVGVTEEANTIKITGAP